MARPDLRSLDVSMLRTFDALLRERSVSRTAARLFLSQPAVSAQLNRLRDTFGDPLFTRTAHGVAPTPRALALAPQVERLLAGMSALLEDPAPFDPALADRVFHVAGSDHASRLILPALSRVLVAQRSGIRIHWQPPGAWPLAERLHRGDLDLAVVGRINPPADLEQAVLYEDHYVYALRAGHPASAEPVTLDAFCAVPQVFLGYGSSALDDLIDAVLARSGRRRLAQFALSSFDQIVHQLEQSDHAAVLGSRVAAAFGSRLQVKPLPFELPRYQALLCWAARADGDRGSRWLRGAILEMFRRAPIDPGGSQAS